MWKKKINVIAPEKLPFHPIGSRILFQAPFFRGELLNFRGVNYNLVGGFSPTPLKNMILKIGNKFSPIFGMNIKKYLSCHHLVMFLCQLFFHPPGLIVVVNGYGNGNGVCVCEFHKARAEFFGDVLRLEIPRPSVWVSNFSPKRSVFGGFFGAQISHPWRIQEGIFWALPKRC